MDIVGFIQNFWNGYFVTSVIGFVVLFVLVFLQKGKYVVIPVIRKKLKKGTAYLILIAGALVISPLGGSIGTTQLVSAQDDYILDVDVVLDINSTAKSAQVDEDARTITIYSTDIANSYANISVGMTREDTVISDADFKPKFLVTTECIGYGNMDDSTDTVKTYNVVQYDGAESEYKVQMTSGGTNISTTGDYDFKEVVSIGDSDGTQTVHSVLGLELSLTNPNKLVDTQYEIVPVCYIDIANSDGSIIETWTVQYQALNAQ